jgi:hypothetical protein
MSEIKRDCGFYFKNHLGAFCTYFIKPFTKMWTGLIDPMCQDCPNYKQKERE